MGAQRMGARRVGAQMGGGPKGGRPKISRFFPSLAPIFVLFLSFSGGLLVEFWWCLKRRDPQMCTFGLSGCRVKPRWLLALFDALFFSPAALLVASHDRGSAQPGLSPVVLPPLLPGFRTATATAVAVATIAFSHLG